MLGLKLNHVSYSQVETVMTTEDAAQSTEAIQDH